MAEQDRAVARDPVDRALGPLCELHHEQLRSSVLGQEAERLGQTHRQVPGAILEQLPAAIGRRVEDAKATGARREDRLEADGTIGVAELLRRVA